MSLLQGGRAGRAKRRRKRVERASERGRNAGGTTTWPRRAQTRQRRWRQTLLTHDDHRQEPTRVDVCVTSRVRTSALAHFGPERLVRTLRAPRIFAWSLDAHAYDSGELDALGSSAPRALPLARGSAHVAVASSAVERSRTKRPRRSRRPNRCSAFPSAPTTSCSPTTSRSTTSRSSRRRATASS